jgi:DNA-directed RNA polymerase subunit RPC12/RpoP
MVVIVATRKSDLTEPVKPSESMKCIDCDQEVWVHMDSLSIAGENLEYIICQQCHVKFPNKDSIAM